MKGYTLILFALLPVVGASLNFPIQRYALTHGFLPLAFTAPRFMIGAALFVLVTFTRDRPLEIGRRDLLTLVAIGVFGIGLNQIALAYALAHSSATTVALLFGTLPVFVAILSTIVHRRRLGARQWLAAATSTVGVAIVVLGATGGLSADATGLFFALVTPLAFGAASVFLGPVLQRHSPMKANTIVSLGALVPILAVSANQLSEQSWSSLGPLDLAALAYGAIVSYFLCSLGLFTLVKLMGAPRVSLFMNLQPFLGAFFAVLLLSERLTPLQAAGGGVIALGIGIAWTARPLPDSAAQAEALGRV